MAWWPFRRRQVPARTGGAASGVSESVQRYLGAGLLPQAVALLASHGREREALELCLQRGDAGGALYAAEGLCARSPDERLELGRSFLQRAWPAQAAALLQAQEGGGRRPREARVLLAEALLALGRELEARRELELALAEDVSDAAAWLLLARTRPAADETDSQSPVPGDRYTVRSLLGRGGSGRVYLAFDRRRGTPVALKLFDATASEPGGAGFLHGLRLVAALGPHPHVLPIIDVDPSLRLATFPYLPGGSLAALAGRSPRPELWRSHIGQIGLGLGHLHRGGVLHLDLKPANVLMAGSTAAVLADFSLARSGPPWPGMGSADYAAPEVLVGESPGTGADLYSLGIVAYELACGVRPFPAGTPIRTEGFRPLAELSPGWPAEDAALVERMLRLDPALRPSLEEILHVLAAPGA
jgi:eukaryotic-like serine/threonine-protein kinase